MDWEVYWGKALAQGLNSEAACEIVDTAALFVDDYGEANELSMVREYWPTHAERWFTAFRGGLPSES